MILPCGLDLTGPCPPDFGLDELGRVAAICYSHVARSVTSINPPPRIPRFEPGWEACERVYAAWADSETGRKRREQEAETERQRQMVNEFAGKLAR